MLERSAFDLKATEGATNHGAIKLAQYLSPRAARCERRIQQHLERISAIQRNGGALPAGSIIGIGRVNHEEVSTRRPYGLVPFDHGVRSKRAVASPSSRASGAGRRAIFRDDAERARAVRGHSQCERLRARSS